MTTCRVVLRACAALASAALLLLNATPLLASTDRGPTSSRLTAVYPGGLTSEFTGIEPVAPAAGQPFTLRVTSGPCEFLSDDPNAATIVSISNNVVSVRIPGVSTTLCDLGFSPRSYVMSGLPAGNYRIDLTFYDIERPGEIGEPAGYIGGRDLQVVARSTATIPANSAYGLGLLGLAVSALAMVLLRKRRHQALALAVAALALVAAPHSDATVPTATLQGQSANLAVSATVSKTAKLRSGDGIVVTTTVRNDGPGPASDVTVSVGQAQQESFLYLLLEGDSPACGPVLDLSINPPQFFFFWNVPTVPAGGMITCTARLQVVLEAEDFVSELVADAHASSASPDPDLSDNLVRIAMYFAAPMSPRIVPIASRWTLIAIGLSFLIAASITGSRHGRA